MLRRHALPALCAMVLAAAFPSATAAAQNIHPTPGPEVAAVRLAEPVRLDGRLDEAVWSTAPFAGSFRQSEPREGEPATQRTEVRFAFDDQAIYVGARMYDDSGAAGVRTRLVRRDANTNSDYIQLIFDTYHDHIGRLFFAVNPSGVKNDANGLGGGGDASWDPVWEVRTTIDSLGWTAEMRIPFAELRYPRTSEPQTWGLQIWRQVNRLNELSMWSWWGRTEAGGPSQFGHLSGLVITGSPGRGELLPYVVTRSSNVPVSNPDDPFQEAHAFDGRIGADARVLLTSNLTLNLTVNPDFGQVEVDPAVVNLSAFETSFEERRPFFVEGAGYFGLGGFSCFFCSNTSSLSTFYSRRIGRQPQLAGAVSTVPGAEFSEVPENTRILGAAKLTGRTRSGWSIGIVDAFTERARATVLDTAGNRTQVTVEPAANYFAARFARDLRGGATVLRGMITSVVRNLENDYQRQRLNAHSEMAGVAADMYWRRRTYRLMTQWAISQVSGDTGAIARLQRSSARYFQRPDREPGGNGFLSNGYDTTATVLRGLAGYARFSKNQGVWLWETAVSVRTPGFENNDIAFISRADYVWMNANLYRQWTQPTRLYRTWNVNLGAQQQYNFDGDRTDRQLHTSVYWQFLNYWSVFAFYIHRPAVIDERLARGGPALMRSRLNDVLMEFSSDSRRKVVVSGGAEAGRNGFGINNTSVFGTVQIRPRSNVSLSLGPQYNAGGSAAQFFMNPLPDTALTAFYGRRYIFGGLRQKSVSLNTRVNLTFTTNLTFELFMQPLISSANYVDYREFAAPRSLAQIVYGRDGATTMRRGGPYGGVAGNADSIILDPDGPGARDSIVFRDPSFTFRSLRGNAVLRWEYRPGSTLFVVWTRSASSQLTRGTIDFGDDAAALLEGPAANIFLVKVNYRVGF
jgi:hypothetical protein